jgi:SAM-dependent methyltransferase
MSPEISKRITEMGDLDLHPDARSLNVSGTMNGASVEATAKYVRGLDSAVSIKTAVMLERLPEIEFAVLVDIGCMTGKLAHEIHGARPLWRVIGVDVNPEYIRLGADSHPDITFLMGDPAKGLLLDPSSVDFFTASGVVHEIHTYNNFSDDAVVQAFANLRTQLKEEGRLILREPVKPANSGEILEVRLADSRPVRLPHPFEREQAVLEELPPAELMRRFLSDFALFRRDPSLLTHVEETSPGIFRMPAWIIGEFIRKRTFSDSAEHWQAEMGEQNAPYSLAEMHEIARRAGFEADNISLEAAFEENFYGTINSEDGIEILDLHGRTIEQRQRFPSHVYGVLQK